MKYHTDLRFNLGMDSVGHVIIRYVGGSGQAWGEGRVVDGRRKLKDCFNSTDVRVSVPWTENGFLYTPTLSIQVHYWKRLPPYCSAAPTLVWRV